MCIRDSAKPVVKTQLIPSRPVAAGPTVQARVAPEARRTGIERMLEPEVEEDAPAATDGILPASLVEVDAAVDPEVTERADSDHKPKTTMPKIAAGGYKLPSSSLLQRPDEQGVVLSLIHIFDTPGPGAAAIGAVNFGGQSMVTLSFYLYGDQAGAIVGRETPLWETWVQEHFPAPSEPGKGEGE